MAFTDTGQYVVGHSHGSYLRNESPRPAAHPVLACLVGQFTRISTELLIKTRRKLLEPTRPFVDGILARRCDAGTAGEMIAR